jgi:hypothetical protein
MLDASGRAMVRRIIRARIEKLHVGLAFGPASMHAVIRAEIDELRQEAIRLERSTTPRTLIQREQHDDIQINPAREIDRATR